jgi:TRAP transporter TAXI family solute receptor
MKATKRTTALVFFLTLFLVLASFGGGAYGAQKVFINIAGGNIAGSAIQNAAAAIANLTNAELPGFNVTPETSAGASENIRRVNSGEVEMAGVFASDMHDAYHEQGLFAGKRQASIRAIGVLNLSYTHIVVLKDSGIKSVADLKGKKVAVGGTGSGTSLMTERYFKKLGMWDDIRRVYLGGNDSATALKDRQVDAFVWNPGIPGPTVVDVASTRDIVLLDVYTPAQKAGFLGENPFYVRGVIPAKVYRGVDQEVPTLQSGAYWIARKDVPENVVYQMTKLCYSPEGVQKLAKSFKPMVAMGKNPIDGITIPLHPGAEKFFREAGIQIPEGIRAK